MEDNLEKQRFFACYWGQFVLRASHWNTEGREDHPSWAYYDKTCSLANDDRYYLELKSLKDITDEDAVAIWSMFKVGENEAGYSTGWKDFKEEILKTGELGFDLFDFYGWSHCAIDKARSLSYLVSWMGLSPEELLKRGWAKIREV